MHYEHTTEWADLKKQYIDAAFGEDLCRLVNNKRVLSHYVAAWKHESRFYGPSSAQVIKWLHDGYHQPGLILEPPLEPVRKRRRISFAEEGELQLDLVYSGYDYPFLVWSERDAKPGIRVNIEISFVNKTKNTLIAEYARFVLRALIALETAGIDCEINITASTDHAFHSDSYSTVTNYVKVKKEGEQIDYLAWSALFSPGGFRHLIFLDHILSADELGKNIVMSLGRGTNAHSWQVRFDPDERVLDFLVPYTPIYFPEKEMTEQLYNVLR